VVVTGIALAVGGMLAYETLRPETFTSYAQLYTSGEVQLSAVTYFNEESQTYFGTQIELLKSSRLQEAALQKAGYIPRPGQTAPVSLEVVQPMKTSLLVLQATGTDPNLVHRFLQALVEEYLAYKKETRRSTSEDIVLSLTEQLTTKERALKAEQDTWSDFQRTNNIGVLEEEGKGAGLYLADLSLQLSKLRLDRELLAKGLSPITNGLPLVANSSGTNGIEEAVDAGAGTSWSAGDAAVPAAAETALKTTAVELSVKRAEREQVLTDRGEMAARHLNDEIARLERTARALQEQSLADRQTRLEQMDKRIAAIEKALPAVEAKVLNVNERLAEGQRLKNNIQREQGFYDHLLTTLQNVDLGRNVQQERLSVLQPPTAPLPVNRHLVIRIILALVFGLVAGMAVVFGWYLLDDRFVSLRDVKDQFGELVLGLIPQVRVPRSKPGAAMLLPNDGRKQYAESYRYLRSALLLSSQEASEAQTLFFTGASPAEGKTTIAVNLAQVLARSGLRVVLIDADAHNEGCKQLLGAADQPGLLDYLRGEAEVSVIKQATDLPGLFFVSAGIHVEHNEGLFLGPRLPNLMQELKRETDFVIVDGPPILSADEAALLVPHADTVILVMRPFFSRSRLVRQALDMLYQRQAKQVAIILNRARKDDFAGLYMRNGKSPSAANGQPAFAGRHTET